MSQVTGIVKEVYRDGIVKTGRSAGKAWWAITLDTDAKLTAFDIEFVKDVEVGKEYTFTIEASGQYVNITAPSVPCIQQDGDTTPPEATTAPQTKEQPRKGTGALGNPYSASNKDEAIRKAVALKAAVEFANGVLGSTATTNKVAEYMREFEELLK